MQCKKCHVTLLYITANLKQKILNKIMFGCKSKLAYFTEQPKPKSLANRICRDHPCPFLHRALELSKILNPNLYYTDEWSSNFLQPGTFLTV